MTQTESAATESPVGKWKPYLAYKDSGVEWLGKIPEHWEATRLKYIARLSYGDSLPADARQEGDIRVFGSNGPVGFHYKSNTLAPVLVIGRKGSFGKVNFSNQPCFAIDTTYFIDARKSRADLRWLFYALLLLRLDAISEDSAIPGLSRELTEEQWLPTMPPSEQHTIATFLDRETTRINALIAKKERLIELLQEKRAALISHAVTKGLDPTVPMKDSGVEWLGEIPQHWEVVPVYSRYNVQLGKMLNQEAVKGISPAPYLRNVNIQWDYVDLSEVLEMDFNPLERQKYDLIFGDLLICEGGEVGRTAIWRGELTECYFQKAIHRVRPLSTQEDGRFLFYVLYAAAKLGVFKAEGNKSTIVHLTAEKLKRHRFAFPSLTEQRSIILFLDHETAKIDTLISKIQEGIEKLKEYSTALISATVTGKIDVRGKITLPDHGDL